MKNAQNSGRNLKIEKRMEYFTLLNEKTRKFVGKIQIFRNLLSIFSIEKISSEK